MLIPTIPFKEIKELLEGLPKSLSKDTQEEVSSEILKIKEDLLDERRVGFSNIRLLAERMVEEVSSSPPNSFRPLVGQRYDDYLFIHPINVASMSVLVGRELEMDTPALKEMATGALVHDLGKLRISSSILNKPGALNYEEIKACQNHPVYGWQILAQDKEIGEIPKEIAYQHHKYYNDSGYPKGIGWNDLNIYSKVVSLVNLYDSLIQDKIYRGGVPPYKAMRVIIKEMGGRVDPEMGKVFLNLFSIYPPGTFVRLSTNEIAIIKSIHKEDIARPVVRLLVDAFGEEFSEEVDLDLSKEKNCFITEVVE